MRTYNKKNIMFLIITSVSCLLVPVLSRYSGDSCYDGDNLGSCTALSRCQHLRDEIEGAGSPMPMHIRKRLHQLGCGFTRDEPLVCCSSDHNSSTNKPATSFTDVFTNGEDGIKVTKPGPNSINDRRDDIDEPQDVTNHPSLALLPRDCGNTDSNRILGGNRTSLYEMPWMVLLAYDLDGETKLSCGGTLINERYVLTAAHCAQSGRMTLNHVILGEYDIRTDPDCELLAGNLSCAPGIVNAKIEEVISHPGYTRQNVVDDIALLRLAEPANINLDNVGPICLPITRELQRFSLDGINGTVAGWGVTEDTIQSSVLLSVQLPIITNEECKKAYKGSPRLYSRQMCAGGVRDKDSCSGDSGGPLLYPGVFGTGGLRYVQRGVVSYGPKRCGIGGLPGVYTRVSHYMSWILDNMRS